MAEIKAHEFGAFLKRRARDFRIFLVYGPDRGLVSERAGELARETGVDLGDAFSFVRLDASDVASDPGRLFDEANTTGLFGGEKLIWIKGAGAEKALADAVAGLAASPPDAAWVIIEAGDLKKAASLRKSVEPAAKAVAVPCYADDAKALGQLIDEELGSGGLRITADARRALQDQLGGDRLASRNEIRKLALYARDAGLIEEHHVTSIVGDASAISADDAVDAVLKGDLPGLQHAVEKVVNSKTPVFLVLQGCLRQLQLLDLMRAEMDSRRISVQEAVNTFGRHLHFRRKPIVEAALKTLSSQIISTELNRIQSAVLQGRKRANMEDTIATQALMTTALVTQRALRRQG